MIYRDLLYPEISYRCPLCKTIFKAREDIIECIKSHVIPEDILEVTYEECENNYPDYMVVKMDNGKKVMYHFDYIMEE